jgi:hypothetical protein
MRVHEESLLAQTLQCRQKTLGCNRSHYDGKVPAVEFAQPYLPENTQLAERGALLLSLEANGIQGRRPWRRPLDSMTGAQMG